MVHKLSRREVLYGLASMGLISALPMRRLLAQNLNAPIRTLFIPLQHGWGISETSNRGMSGTENEFNFPPGLDPFNSIRQHCVVIDGLLTLGNWGNNHDLSYADILTAGVPNGMESSSFEKHMPLSVTPSIDYLIEQHSAKPAFRFSAGYRSWGTAYHPLSFDASSSVLPFFTSAFDAYKSIFANLPENPNEVEGQQETQLLNSIFRYIKKPAQIDLSHLNSVERDKVTRYLSAVTDLETKKKNQFFSGTEELNNVPVKNQNKLIDVSNYLEMIKVGFANDMTRTAVLGIGDIHGISQFHHDHAHSNSDTWWNTRSDFANNIVSFVNDLAGIVDFDGNTLLSNTIIVLTGEVGDGGHNILKKGHIVIGGGGGTIATNRWVRPSVIQGSANINALMREDINGVLKRQVNFGNTHTMKAGSRTNADLFREIGNIAGLSLSQFGLASQNKGDVLNS